MALEKEIKELENKHSNDKDDVSLQQLNRAKLKFSTLNNRAAEIVILKIRQRYVEHGESTGK